MEVALFAFVLVLFFGARKLPALSRAIGESVREFKRGRLEDPESAASDPTLEGAVDTQR